MDEYYTIFFEEIEKCDYSVEAPNKKEALKYAIKLWKKEHKSIPVIDFLSHYFSEKTPQRMSKVYGKKDCKKFLDKS